MHYNNINYDLLGLGLLKTAASSRSVARVSNYKKQLRDAIRRLSESSPSLRRVPLNNNKATVPFDVINSSSNSNTDLALLPKAELAKIIQEVQSGKKLTRQQLGRVKKLLNSSIPPVDGGNSIGSGASDFNPPALLDKAKTKSSKWLKQLLAALGLTAGGSGAAAAWLASDDDSSEPKDQHPAASASDTDTIDTSDDDDDDVSGSADTAPIHAPARESKIFTGKNIGMTTGALASAIAANRLFKDRSTAERAIATLAGFVGGGYGGRKLGEMFDS